MNNKKFLAAISAIILTAGTGSLFVNASSVKAGDINGDGKTNIADLCISKNILIDGSSVANAAADVNQDGAVNAADSLLLQNYLLGIIDNLPDVKEQNSSTPAVSPTEYMNDLRANLTTPEPSSASQKQANVDYGTVKSITYFSTTANRNKKANVILPAGYNENEKYPVLYLNHGIFGDENSMLGDDMGIQTIAGNLAASGEAEKMIIVCTSMYSSKTEEQPPSFTFNDQVMQGYDDFLYDLTKDLMPYIEQNFSIKTGRENTGITGFSMGGREALYIGISRPDLFGYIGGACPAPGVTPATDMFMTHKGCMQESEFKIKDTANNPYVLMISGAVSDPVVGTNPENYHNILTANGCDHVWQSIPNGGHDGVSVKAHFYNFAKYLFKAGSGSTSSGNIDPYTPTVTEPYTPTVTEPYTPAVTEPYNPSVSVTPSQYMESVRANIVTPEPSSASSTQPNVDYGTVKKITYFSTTANRQKSANVILPAGYNENEKYPVMYVNHGIFGNEDSMLGSDMGIQTIAGNLAASGEAQKMIIVCGDMFSSSTMSVPGGFDTNTTQGYDAYLYDLTKDLMPYIEQNFSVKTGRENTAITGFSMGGREALYIGISRPDIFGYIGAACPAPGITPTQDNFMVHPGCMQESEFKIKDTANSPYVLMISGAVNDGVVGNHPEKYHNMLTQNGCDHIWQSIPQGGHDGVSVRAHFYNFAKAAFNAK